MLHIQKYTEKCSNFSVYMGVISTNAESFGMLLLFSLIYRILRMVQYCVVPYCTVQYCAVQYGGMVLFVQRGAMRRIVRHVMPFAEAT